MHVVAANTEPPLLVGDRLLTCRTNALHVSQKALPSLFLNLGVVRAVRPTRFLYRFYKVIDLGYVRIVFHHGVFVFP